MRFLSLRNPAYDTLLQMEGGSVIDNYAKFCKIYLPRRSISWYTLVTSANKELYLEIKK